MPLLIIAYSSEPEVTSGFASNEILRQIWNLLVWEKYQRNFESRKVNFIGWFPKGVLNIPQQIFLEVVSHVMLRVFLHLSHQQLRVLLGIHGWWWISLPSKQSWCKSWLVSFLTQNIKVNEVCV